MKRWTALTYLAGGLFLCAFAVLLVAQAEAADVIISDSTPEIIFDDSDNGDDWRIFANHNVDGFGLGSMWRLFKGGGAAVIDIRGDEATYSTNLPGSLLIDSAGNLHFADDGMIFDRFNARMGIGLTTPGYTLDAIGNRIRLRNSTAAAAKSIQMRTDGTWIDLQAANSDLLISTTGAHNIYLSSNRVGVGTSSPFYKFSVSGGNSDLSTLHFTNTGTDVGGWLTSVADNNFFVSSGAMWNGAGWVQKSPDGLAVMAGSGPSGYRVMTRSGCAVGATCAVTTRMMIDYSGNVGFGIVPVHPLH
ncbi:MAG TPA: hypothetical protein VN260_01590, partial [Dissulfurispiraceae bacterium]|nr:hypothetical protein [Dissulfurispiraceae bacterium]